MKDQPQTLARIAERLDRAGIPFVVVGSVASSVLGEMRATNDIGIVIVPADLKQLEAFAGLLGGDYYLSSTALKDAWQRRSMFNVIDYATGWKVDLIVKKETPFDEQTVARRRFIDLGEVTVPILTAEDAILSKLQWASLNEPERQMRDAIGVAKMQWDTLDHAYLKHWSTELKVADRLAVVLLEADAIRQARVE